MGSTQEPIQMCEAASKDQEISPLVTKASHRHRLASLTSNAQTCPKGHAQSDSDSGPRLGDEGTNLGNG